MTIGAVSLTGCGTATTNQASAPAAAAPAVSAAAPAGPSGGISAAAKAPASPAAAAKAKTANATATAKRAAEKVPAAAAPAPVAKTAPRQVPPVAAAPATAAAAKAVPAPAKAAAPVKAASPVKVRPAAPASSGTQAATAHGWGPVVAGDEFSYAGAPDRTKWGVYNGSGHAGKGVRSPQAWSVGNGVATVSGNSAGTTGGMSAKFAQQKYGRWETRMKTNVRDSEYHPVLILWPNNNASPNCAEIDYAEGTSETALMKFFLHYACGGGDFQKTISKPVDSTQWHNYAVEWTPAGITGYVDGVKTFTDTNPAHQPSVGMHQTLQLDWFPDGSATSPSQMQVDWVRVYR